MLQEAVLAQEKDIVCGEMVMEIDYLLNLAKALLSMSLFSLVISDNYGRGILLLDVILDLRRKRTRS